MSSQTDSPCLPSPPGSGFHEVAATGRAVGIAAPVLPELGQELRRWLVGLSLAGLYGLSLGARGGGLALVRHALGVPATLLALGALAVPSLFVVLSLFDAPVTLERTIAATARATAASGLLLAGLAPATTLLVVTIDSAPAAAFVARAGLLLAACFGGLPLLASLHAELRPASAGTRFKSRLALLGFALFGCALAARMASSLLPILGGAS